MPRTPVRTFLPLALALAGLIAGAASAAPAAQPSFKDDFGTLDTARWMRADGWGNGSPFNSTWKADHITVASNLMSIRLDNVAALGKPYSSGSYQSNGYHGYGCFEVRFKPVSAAGVVSSFFTFAGPSDNGGNGRHNEIDIGFIGNNTRRLQTNFWTNDDAYKGSNDHMVDLPFDAAQGLHQYAFKWTSAGIEWFVDGVPVYKVLDSALKPTPKAGDSLQKIMTNLWPVDSTAADWAGAFVYPGTPLSSAYDWVRYTAGEDCTVSLPAPGSAANEVHAQDITLALASTGQSATAQVLVLNGLGQPVPTAPVIGVWSGALKGTTTGLTDATGRVTLTSAPSTKNGTATFCISAIAAEGLRYVDSANTTQCLSIKK